MKCPHCGKETKEGKSCENCGKGLAPAKQVEILYKDFKVSELLDIKLRKEVPDGKEMTETAAGRVEENALSSVGKKRAALIVTAFIVAAAIVLFLLLRLLLKF